MRRIGTFLGGIVGWGISSDVPIVRFPDIPVSPDYNVGMVGESATTIGQITEFRKQGSIFMITCENNDQVRVEFYREDVVRVWLGWSGNFSDDVSEDIVVAHPLADLEPTFSDQGQYFEMKAVANSHISLRAQKSPLQFAMFRDDVQVWKEAVGVSKNSTATFQTLLPSDDEQFFGGGMQNGRFAHKGHRIRVSTDGNWADGGNPNAAPVWFSSAGFGIYRNTWSPGFYDFSESPTVFSHHESRFDAFFFVSAPRNFRGLLEGYTFITGRPFMPPVYALGLGDSDCYHNERHGDDTHVVVAIADKYRAMDMPGTWFLPNDGYGCGYGVGPGKFPHDFDVLDDVAHQLRQRGFETGLWSSTGLPNIAREVNGSGVRIGKTDVGWIGSGYKYAFDSCKLVAEGIENNSDGRRFIWTVEGWAGTQRLAVMWTGDDYGTFDYLRWQIPTFVGCGFSAQAHVSGDIDGIFGGSPETYVRDLQMKSMMTVLMTMSGWAANPDKQPWTWGEPYTSINRMYLKMKMRLIPYMYSLSREAYETGFPPVRAMALEFPNDNATLINGTGTSQQFMAGPWFLVAPVYTPLAVSQTRDGIYLPMGDWVDYWNWDSITTGPTIVNGYLAPLDRLPLFVRAGAIIPMWPEMLYPGEKPVDPLSLEIFPSATSNFELYEDDGKTREALEGSAFAKTNITSEAHVNALQKGGRVKIDVSASVGTYKGQLPARSYDFRVHGPHAPFEVLLTKNGSVTSLPMKNSLSELDYASNGWFFVKGFIGNRKGGMTVVKTPSLAIDEAFSVTLSTGPNVPHISLNACKASSAQAFDISTGNGQISLRSNSSSCLSVGADKDSDSGTPALEMLACNTSNVNQIWVLEESGNLHLKSDASKCVDLDRNDRRAEMYSCGGPPAQVNQRWIWHNVSGQIVTALDNSCMTASLDVSAFAVDAIVV